MKTLQKSKQSLRKSSQGLFLIGLMAALGLTLMAFEWATFNTNYEIDNVKEVSVLEPEVLVEVIPEPPKPKVLILPPPPSPVLDTLILTKDTTPELFVADTASLAAVDLGGDIKPVEGDDDGDPEMDNENGLKEPHELSKMPSFPGGLEAMYTYLGKTIKYTRCGIESGINGRVYVQFTIEKDGTIGDTKVVRGLDCGLNQVAVKSVEKMPKWEAGEQMGKPVRVKYTLPIQFTLK